MSGASVDMELECELVTGGVSTGGRVPDAEKAKARPRRVDWCLLAQFDCGEFWTEGLEQHEWFVRHRLLFWIKREDLASRRFENAWALTRC